MAEQRFDGQVAVVTGAGSGIGRATALAFARAGARVAAVDVDLAAAEKAAAACEEAGGVAHAHRCDVGDFDAVVALATALGPVDVLVNNAGVGMSGRLADMTIDDWRWIRSVNLDGVVHGCLAFGPAMLERGRGHVVNLSSGLAYTPRSTEPAYVTTKAAVLALSRSIRADWGKRGVGVSAICPGVIDTAIIRTTRFLGAQASPRRRARVEKVFRRGHRPEEVADAIVAAVRRNRAIVPVGWEAKLGWWVSRYAPIGLQQFVARQEPK